MRSAHLPAFVTIVATLTACVFTPRRADAQVDCWAPREQEDSVATAKFAPMRQTLLTIEDVIRRNTAYQTPPEPVRMRTTIAAGPDEKAAPASSSAPIHPCRPPLTSIWTKSGCGVIPQAERVAASVGQIYAFVNYSVREQFLGGHEVPQYEGEFAGYPIYNGWIVMTKDRRLPWIPQTLGDRLAREEERRQRELDEWQKTKSQRKLPDEAAVRKSYEAVKKIDPAAAEKLVASFREVAEQVRKAKADEPRMDAHLQGHLEAVRKYRGSFSRDELNAPAVWMDRSGEGKKRLDAGIAELQKLTPDEQRPVETLGRESRDLERPARVEATTNRNAAAAAALRERSHALAVRVREIRKAHIENAFFPIQDARAEYELTNLKPGAREDAMAFKPDPAFPDFTDPFRPQVILVRFWSKSDPEDNSPRTMWLRKAKETFNFPALAALLR